MFRSSLSGARLAMLRLIHTMANAVVLSPGGNALIHLESVKARSRAAETQRAFTVLAGRALSPSALSADDVPELVAEVMDLRHAVAARPIAGEVLTLREAVRTEVISMCAEYAAMVDAVRALHTPEPHGGMYCAYASGDRPECQECYPEGEDTGPGHTRMVCKECRVDEPWLNAHNRMQYPCPTALLLEPDTGAATNDV